jgi:hypothetical protein
MSDPATGIQVMKPHILLALALMGASTTMASARQCMISDPTGTPLNFRASPNGERLGAFRNGMFVTLLGQSRDNRGRVWANVKSEDMNWDVWVIREYISCR